MQNFRSMQCGTFQFHAFINGLLTKSPKWVGMDNGDFVVEANSLEQKSEIENLHQKIVDGHGQMILQPIFESMSIAQCMEHLLQSVENDEDLEETRKVLGMGLTYAIESKSPKPPKQNNVQGNSNEHSNSPTFESHNAQKSLDLLPKPYVPPQNFPFLQHQNEWGKGWGRSNEFFNGKGKGFEKTKSGNKNVKGGKGLGKGNGRGKGENSNGSHGRGKGNGTHVVNEVSQGSSPPQQ